MSRAVDAVYDSELGTMTALRGPQIALVPLAKPVTVTRKVPLDEHRCYHVLLG